MLENQSYLDIGQQYFETAGKPVLGRSSSLRKVHRRTRINTPALTQSITTVNVFGSPLPVPESRHESHA